MSYTPFCVYFRTMYSNLQIYLVLILIKSKVRTLKAILETPALTSYVHQGQGRLPTPCVASLQTTTHSHPSLPYSGYLYGE